MFVSRHGQCICVSAPEPPDHLCRLLQWRCHEADGAFPRCLSRNMYWVHRGLCSTQCMKTGVSGQLVGPKAGQNCPTLSSIPTKTASLRSGVQLGFSISYYVISYSYYTEYYTVLHSPSYYILLYYICLFHIILDHTVSPISANDFMC